MADILKWLPFALGLVLFVGTAVVYFRGSWDKGTIETLERNNSALTARVLLLEPLVARVELLERENAVLRTVDSAKEEIVALRAALADHHGQAMEGMGQIHTDLVSVARILATGDKK